LLDNGRISSIQLSMLLFMTEAPTAILFPPSIIAEQAGPDAWISVLVPISLYGFIVALICIALARRYPKQVFTEYLPDIVGWLPGKLLALVYTLVFIHIASFILAECSLFIRTAFLRETPSLPVVMIILIAVVYGVFLGIEVIARHNELVFPLFILSMFLLIVLVANNIDLNNLRPVLAKGFIPVLSGSYQTAIFRGEIFILLMLFPYLNQKTEAHKSVMTVMIMMMIFATTIIFVTIGVFGPLVTSQLTFPYYSLARYISLAKILEQMELYLVIFWMAGIIVKLAIFLHSACIAAASTFNFRNYRMTIIPIAIISTVVCEALYSTNYLNFINFFKNIWPLYGLSFELIVPGIVLLVAIIRRKGLTSSAQTKS